MKGGDVQSTLPSLGGWPSGDWARQALQDRRAPLAAALALAVAAVLQIALKPGHSALAGSYAPPEIFLILMILTTTLPLGLLWAQPRTAAVIIAIANLLPLGLAHVWTLAGLAALVIMLYRLGYLGVAGAVRLRSGSDHGAGTSGRVLDAAGADRARRRRTAGMPGPATRDRSARRAPPAPPSTSFSPGLCWSTPRAASGPASRANCTMWSRTTSR